MTDIYSQQRRNRKITALLVAGFLVLVVSIGLAIDLYTTGSIEALRYPVATIASVVIASVYCAASIHWGPSLIASSTGAVKPDPEDLMHKRLHNVVVEMALASGVPMPRVYVVPDPAPNAFAAGKDPDNSIVAVTQGLLDTTSREELQAVVAHELAHIKNCDVRTMTVVAALLGTVALMTDWAIRTWRYGGIKARGKRGGLHPVALIVLALFVLLSPIVSRLMAMAVSRAREFQADASSAEFTRNPLALASALEKIGEHTSPVRSAHKGTAHLFISDPLKRRSDDREGLFANLFSTHPPLERRIERLRRMGYAWDRFRTRQAPAPAPESEAV